MINWMNGKIKKFSTGNSVKTKEWSIKNQKVYSGVVSSFEINNHLDKLRESVLNFHYQAKSSGKTLSINELITFFHDSQGKDSDKQKSLLQCYDEFLIYKLIST